MRQPYPVGGGGACDSSVLPEILIQVIQHNRNWGATAAGRSPSSVIRKEVFYKARNSSYLPVSSANCHLVWTVEGPRIRSSHENNLYTRGSSPLNPVFSPHCPADRIDLYRRHYTGINETLMFQNKLLSKKSEKLSNTLLHRLRCRLRGSGSGLPLAPSWIRW